MNDNNLEQQNKQEDAGKKAAHLTGKAASEYFAPGVGGKLYDTAKKMPVLGKRIDSAEQKLGKNLNRNPILKKGAQKLNDSGALDAADKAVDAKSGLKDGAKGGSSLPKLPSGLSKGKGVGSLAKGLKSTIMGGNASGETSTDDDFGYASKILSLIKDNLHIFLPIIAGFFQHLFILILVIVIVGSPVGAVVEFFSGIADAVVGFFSPSQEQLEQEFYETLKEVETDMIDKGLCIDVNLITVALTINESFDNTLEDGNVNVDDTEDNPSYNPDSENPEDQRPTVDRNYKKMKKQIKLLANMQVMTKKYELKYENDSYCSETEEKILITEGSKDSSTKSLIASHDMGAFGAFFTKKSNEEKNYAYYIYKPAYEVASDGTTSCSYLYARDELPSEEKEISIGDYVTREDSVFYWNLINSFIPDYYSDYVPREGDPEREEKIRKIADDIYLLYRDVGPSSSCQGSDSYICRSDEGSDFYSGDRAAFIENAAPIAIDEMTRTGVFSSITLAQAALESGNGGSGLSTRYSNYYGMTAGRCAPSLSPSSGSGTVYQSGEGGNTCNGNEFWNGSVVAMCNSEGLDCQWYRIYDSFANSTRDHSRLLSDSYGCNVYSSYQEQLNCIVSHGYATDPEYQNKISRVINTYNLEDYDIGNWNGTYNEATSNQFQNNLCYSNGSASGEFTSWKQYDAAWSNVPLGRSTVGRIGCAMTSVTIQIMRSGVSTLIANFNPGTFAQKMTSIGGFDASGNIYWGKVEEVAPNFKFVERVGRRVTPSEVNDLVNQGYYIILNVKNGRHWVAVDRVEGNKIFMFDPGSGGIEVGQTYGLSSIVGYSIYRRG